MTDKKQLKKAYKELVQPAGIFQIRNKKSGRLFLGNSATLNTVWNAHHFQLKIGQHPNNDLQIDWDRQSESDFAFEIVETIKDVSAVINLRGELALLGTMLLEELRAKGILLYNKK